MNKNVFFLYCGHTFKTSYDRYSMKTYIFISVYHCMYDCDQMRRLIKNTATRIFLHNTEIVKFITWNFNEDFRIAL